MAEQKKLSCYLAGNFTAWDGRDDWRDIIIEKLSEKIDFYNPLTDTKQGAISQFVSGDLTGVERCDCTFYFMTDGKGDVGAACECAHANAKNKLVIICLDKELKFVHPFPIGISRRVLISLEAGIQYLANLAEFGIENELQASYKMLSQPKK